MTEIYFDKNEIKRMKDAMEINIIDLLSSSLVPNRIKNKDNAVKKTDGASITANLPIKNIGEKKWKEFRKSNEEHVLETIKERLEKFCTDVSAELPSCPFITDDIVVKMGNPVEEIILLAEAINCDMIVMGAHGHGVLGDTIMGSTSRRVLRRCKKPVLVVRLP